MNSNYQRIQNRTTLFALVLLSGCGTDTPPGPDLSVAAGTYTATTLERENADGVIDDLAAGGSINLTLSTNGVTSGRLFVPAASASTNDFDADLAGTWTINGPLVRLEHTSNTFLVDIALLFSQNQLAGERTGPLETIRVILTR